MAQPLDRSFTRVFVALHLATKMEADPSKTMKVELSTPTLPVLSPYGEQTLTLGHEWEVVLEAQAVRETVLGATIFDEVDWLLFSVHRGWVLELPLRGELVEAMHAVKEAEDLATVEESSIKEAVPEEEDALKDPSSRPRRRLPWWRCCRGCMLFASCFVRDARAEWWTSSRGWARDHLLWNSGTENVQPSHIRVILTQTGLFGPLATLNCAIGVARGPCSFKKRVQWNVDAGEMANHKRGRRLLAICRCCAKIQVILSASIVLFRIRPRQFVVSG